jgi:uncharacterized protein YkwD
MIALTLRAYLMRTMIRRTAILSMLSALLVTGGMATRAQSLRAVDIEAQEHQAETLIAQGIETERVRLAPNARPFASDPTLARLARARSQAMANGVPFAHEDDKGRFAADVMVRAEFGHYGAVGENIMMERDPARAFDPEAFARRAVQGWMNSEGHRANILGAQYDRAGVGVAINGSYAYATQLFWGPPEARPRRR